MAASLDDTARGIEILPRNYPLQLQEGPAASNAQTLHPSALHYVHDRETVRCNQTPSIWIMCLYYMYRYVTYMCLRSLTSLYFKLIAFVQCTLNIKVQHIIITYQIIPKTDKLPQNRDLFLISM